MRCVRPNDYENETKEMEDHAGDGDTIVREAVRNGGKRGMGDGLLGEGISVSVRNDCKSKLKPRRLAWITEG
ncbi:hypothetical protein BWQ96_05126 [Gracilariopsis chorda]|uniref:Uncharacterized protein n=1 Tax=Gracilariopsis chorda TaxID=448386 RepID=A0A2V3ITN4_9FLOR|nr:hypothetical protein BWQ96_05126 [Gracilariopsis chorda]|eukprot:PXF45087.1 hypothetical protein BWQ96_05126 [Gracilariopsis chorda]